MEVMNKGHPIQGWPPQPDTNLPAVFLLVTGKRGNGRVSVRRPILGVRFIRAPGVMRRLPEGKPLVSLCIREPCITEL